MNVKNNNLVKCFANYEREKSGNNIKDEVTPPHSLRNLTTAESTILHIKVMGFKLSSSFDHLPLDSLGLSNLSVWLTSL